MRHVSYMNFVMASLTMESLWLSGRASEREISIPHGDSEFFSLSRSRDKTKYIFLLEKWYF